MAPKSSEERCPMAKVMSDPVEASTEVDSSSPEKQKADNEDEEEEYEEYDEDEFYGKDYVFVPPEWDVDSFDGRDYTSSDQPAYSDKELEQQCRRYCRQVMESKGFFVGLDNIPKLIFGGVWPVTDLNEAAGNGETVREYWERMASMCLEIYNSKKGLNVQFVSVERGNLSGGARLKSYITFMAKEFTRGPLVEYQAKVLRTVTGENYPIL